MAEATLGAQPHLWKVGGGGQGKETKNQGSQVRERGLRTKVLGNGLLSCHSGPFRFGERGDALPVGAMLRGGSHLSTNSTGEARRTSRTSWTLRMKEMLARRKVAATSHTPG